MSTAPALELVKLDRFSHRFVASIVRMQVVTGAQSVADGTEAVRVIAAMIRDLGLNVSADPEITIQNIVFSGDLGYVLNLSAIAIGLGLEYVEYEPEQFPGLLYRMDDPPVYTPVRQW